MTGKMRTLRRHSGVTLLELMVAIAVVGVLLAIGIPSFQYFILDSRRIALGNDLLASVMLARSESIKQGQPVAICASTDGATCASSSSGWNSGWIVRQPPTGTGQVVRYVKNDSGTTAVALSVPGIVFQQFGSCQVQQLNTDGSTTCTASSLTTTVCDTQKSNYNGSNICRGSKVVVQSSGASTLRSTDADSPNPCAC